MKRLLTPLSVGLWKSTKRLAMAPGIDLLKSIGGGTRLRNVAFERKMEMPLFYKGVDVGTRRVDFFVETGSGEIAG